MKLIWDGPTKGKKFNFWSCITKGGKINLLETGKLKDSKVWVRFVGIFSICDSKEQR